MNTILINYINYFKFKPISKCHYTTLFITSFQQKINKSSGYGYINLADHLITRGETKNKLSPDAKEYYNYLVHSESISELEELIGMKSDEILNVKIDPENGEPNQKWHLLVSYLGMKWFQNKKPYIHLVSCPELWLWMFESSGKFKEKEIKAIYNTAVAYKTNDIKYRDWMKFLKEYRGDLHTIIMEHQ